jgi:hypothetical protein
MNDVYNAARVRAPAGVVQGVDTSHHHVSLPKCVYSCVVVADVLTSYGWQGRARAHCVFPASMLAAASKCGPCHVARSMCTESIAGQTNRHYSSPAERWPDLFWCLVTCCAYSSMSTCGNSSCLCVGGWRWRTLWTTASPGVRSGQVRHMSAPAAWPLLLESARKCTACDSVRCYIVSTTADKRCHTHPMSHMCVKV